MTGNGEERFELEPRLVYLFSRLNLIGVSEHKETLEREFGDQASYLMGVITRRGVTVQTKGYEWGFFNVELLHVDHGQFVCGYLAKYKPFDTEEVVVTSEGRIGSTELSDHCIAKSSFFLHAQTKVMAFHPVPNFIRENVFRSVFAQLFHEASGRFMVDARVEIIDEESKILDEIRSFDRIDRLQIELHPSNPNNSEIWRSTDERLKRMAASLLKEEYTSKTGLQIPEEGEPFSHIVMAGDGYGRAKITGIAKGRRKVASTQRVPLEAVGPRDDQLGSTLRALAERFVEVWDRVKQR